ncbi:glycoside hydrolase family 28 protein [Sphingobium sp. AP50]|uniref:glycoside hydrolase family 28 protein n=1 Tax=Sphingobium sp. AP50 TaxID=1884369 RepID=UPI0015A6FD2C|nr:glycosyl hydrolase family 28 protein [Sphingobium sp. AP50]
MRPSLLVTYCGAVADGVTLNTKAIQTGIERLAATGGGTLVVPPGIFLSGALFFRPGVHLHLAKGATLRCTTDMAQFPPGRTRIEGHFEEHFTPALINANQCDGFRITGMGVLDGAGRSVWDQFWHMRATSKNLQNFSNLSLPRARLALIQRSRHVLVEGITFKDSQFWNLHLYNCDQVKVRNARFEVPDDYKQAPSTDGIDVDSCRHVTIDGCHFSVTDDCVAAKGSKGFHAMKDTGSPPVEHLTILNCTFRRGHHAFACGSEATIVRNVLMRNCKITGPMALARLKLRTDTPQIYEDIRFEDIILDSHGGVIVSIEPWTQYHDLHGDRPPRSVVRNIRFSRIQGRFGKLGFIRANPGQTKISCISIHELNVDLADTKISASELNNIKFDSVVINGKTINPIPSNTDI